MLGAEELHLEGKVRKLDSHQDNFILRMVDVTKEFPGVLALDHVNFEVRQGEVHALVGENGAGKSTLIKILAGIYSKDSGEIILNGERVEITSPLKAQDLGLAFVHQDLNLIPDFTIAQNVLLTREKVGTLGLVDWRAMRKEASVLLQRFGIDLDVRQKVKDLSVAQQQLVALAKALALNPRLIVFDEPTAPLSSSEVETLCEVIGTLQDHGVTVIYISHRLEEICQLCDRVTVLRDGQVVGTVSAEADLSEIIRMMIGTQLDKKFYKESVDIGEVVLEVRDLTRDGHTENVSFVLRRGEILGIGGLLGAGRSELVRLIFGADQRDAGEVLLNGKPIDVRSPRSAIRQGIALVPEDRRDQGVMVEMTVRENITLSSIDQFCKASFIMPGPELAAVKQFVGKVGIKTSGVGQEVKYLSGGNQQKTVIAKWLCSNAKVFLFDEPTKGLDVGAKVEIYRLIADLVREGAAVVIVSSEIPELLGLCDRILVMRRGHVVAELDAAKTSQAQVLSYAAGGQVDCEVSEA